jgi:mannan endo-1,4-beta-mannosidase
MKPEEQVRKLKTPLLGVLGLALLAAGQATASTNEWGDGVNLQPSYYNSGNVDMGYSLMSEYSKIKTLRIEIDVANTSVTISQIKEWISDAVDNGYDVICTYHDCSNLGNDNTTALYAAATWWYNNYATLAQAGDFTINLSNEWGSTSLSAANFASYYNTAITTVRKVYSGPIVIDIPGYSSQTGIAAAASDSITDDDIIFSVHIYPSTYVSGSSHYMQTSDLDTLNNSGRPCMVGEFGTGSGSTDVSTLVTYAHNLGWTVLGWAWNGDGNDLNMVTPAWSDDATATSFSTNTYFTSIYSLLSESSSSDDTDDTTTTTTSYEAESATATGTTTTSSDSTASGSKYVFIGSSATLTWTVTAASAGYQTITFGYTAPYGSKVQNLYVNGTYTSALTFSSATSWSTLSTSVYLNAGSNTIKIATGWGWMNFDYLSLASSSSSSSSTTTTTTTTTSYEAESATATGTTTTSSDSTASGSKYVFIGSSATLTWTVTAASAGSRTVTFGYTAPYGNKVQNLYVNGTYTSALTFSSATSWSTLSTSVYLNAGSNTIKIATGWGWMNFDYITVK